MLDALDVISADGSETRLDHDNGSEEDGDRETTVCSRRFRCTSSQKTTNRQTAKDRQKESTDVSFGRVA